MAKISALPTLGLDRVDGTETLPVVKGAATLRFPASEFIGKLAEPYLDRAAVAADRAEAALLVLEVTTAGGWFGSESDPELLALPNGTGAFINTPEGDFYTVEMVAGAPVRRTTFLTRFTDRYNGLNMWEYAKGDGVTDDTVAINTALAVASALGIGRVNWGGPSLTYLLGGPFVVEGEFAVPGSAPVPFNRYKVRLYSDTHHAGHGAALKLSPGSAYPGGIFGHPWWDGERLENVKITGLVLDGDSDNQIIPPLAAGFNSHSVWQHGNAVSIAARGFEFAHNKVRNIHGYGVSNNWATIAATPNPDMSERPENVEVHHNEFFNVHTQACAAQGFNTSFHDNLIHGDGFWVGGLDIETGSPGFPIQTVRAYNNTYDFRDGLAPVEGNKSYNTDSAEALAARRKTRQAITSYSPGADSITDVIIRDETIYQGTITMSRCSDLTIDGVRIANVYEDLTGYNGSPPNTIGITGFDVRLNTVRVINSKIYSELDGYGIFGGGIDGINVTNCRLKGLRKSTIRLDACSGSVNEIDAEDFGMDDSGYAAGLVGTDSSAVALYGGQTRMLQVSNVRATETRSGAARRVRHAVYANLAYDPITRIENCTANGELVSCVRDVNNSAQQAGNVSTSDRRYVFTAPVEMTNSVVVSSGDLTLVNSDGSVGLGLDAGSGETAAITIRNGGSLETIISQNAGGQLNFTTLDGGVVVGNPLAVGNDGRLVVAGDWRHAVRFAGIGFLWMDESQTLRVKGSAPTSDTDGTVVGAQV